MDVKLLLLKSASLLYQESHIDGALQNSADTIREIAQAVEVPETSNGEFGTERDSLAALKRICLDMCAQPASHQYAQAELLQKVRHAVRDEDFLYNAFKEGIEEISDENQRKIMIANLRFDIKEHDREKKITKILDDAAYVLKFKRGTITNLDGFMADVGTKLEPLQRNSKDEDPAVIIDFNLNDTEKVKEVFKSTQELNNEEGIMRVGWQGVNRMFGGGIRRGECILMAALQHNFKTGFTLSLFKHIALYNKPYMLDPKKKPALVRITLEDPLTNNLPFLYRNIYENKTGNQADVLGTSVEDMTKCIQDELQVNGYTIFMREINPTQWDYMALQNYILGLEAQGYEIHVCMVDYLGVLPTTGCMQGGPMGSDKRDLLRRTRNFFRQRRTAFITPWQLSTEAKKLVRTGLEETFVQEIANKGYYDSCSTIDQEVDMEVYFHIVKADGRSFLTIQRGKHRTCVRQTPERYKYLVLPFHEIGDVRDDINGPDSALKKPGGMPLESAEKNTWFSFDA